MKYILIILIFTGPTSADKIKYGGTFVIEKECNDKGKSYESWICIPVEK